MPSLTIRVLAVGSLLGAAAIAARFLLRNKKKNKRVPTPHVGGSDDLRVDTIAMAIEAFRNGIPIVVMDDEDRENEGDIIIPGVHATEEIVAIMILHTSGILCVPMPEEVATRLALPPMLAYNQDAKGTAFTVSADVRIGTTTGVSAYDRMKTFQAMADPNSTAEMFARPGHVFPLRARRGGVMERRGHTEASVDLCRLAGVYPPVAVIGELTAADGSMMRLKECHDFARARGYPIVTIEHLATYLVRHPLPITPPSMAVTVMAECLLPINHGGVNCGVWRMRCYQYQGNKEHVALIYGEPSSTGSRAMVRIHSECFTGDVLSSMKCDCGDQLHLSFERIVENGSGVILYMTGHEGRGIGLVSKIQAYRLQNDLQLDTYAANVKLGYPDDMRSYDAAIAMLKDMSITRFTLLTNSPTKVAAMVDHFDEVVDAPLRCAHNDYSRKYLLDKRNHESRLRAGGIGSSFAQMTTALQFDFTKPRKSLRIGVVRAMWHNADVSRLGAAVRKHFEAWAVEEVFEVVVPGVCSIPYGVTALAQSDVDAILCLGAIIATDYPPPNFIGRVAALSTMGIAFASDIPVLYGVLSCHDTQHLTDMTSDGSEVPLALALGTLRMATLYERDFSQRSPSVPFNFVPQASAGIGATPPSAESFGNLEPYEDMRVAILYSAWREDQISGVVESLVKNLEALGVISIEKVRVPGMLELAREVYLSRQRGFDVALCVGIVTPSAQDDIYVNILMQAATRMLSSLCESYAVECDTPTVNCLVTNDTNVDALVPYWARSAVYLATMRQVRYPKLNSTLSPRTPWQTDVKSSKLQGLKVAIIRTAWHADAVDRLHANCVAQLRSKDVSHIVDVIVPGQFELAHATYVLSLSNFDAILCLAVSIPDGTAHFEYVTRASLDTLVDLQLRSAAGIAIGVVPCRDSTSAVTLCSDVTLASSLIDALQFVCAGRRNPSGRVSLTAADVPAFLKVRGPSPSLPLLAPPPLAQSLRVVIVTTLSCEVSLARHRDSVIKGLINLGVSPQSVFVEYVPSVTEMQYAVQQLRLTNVDVIICLGAVVQDTFESFRLICEGCTSQLQVESVGDIPVLCGVHMCSTVEQLDHCFAYVEGFANAAVHMGSFRRYAIQQGLLTVGPRPNPPLTPTIAPMTLTQVVMQPPSDNFLTRVALPENRGAVRVGIVSCAWLSDYQRVIVEVTRETLLEHGVPLANLREIVVPMVSDLGLGAKLLLARNAGLSVVICIGVTVSGGALTSCDHRASPAARGVELCQAEHSVPIISAVTAVQTQRQASQRVAISNPWGRQIALTALHMVALSLRYPDQPNSPTIT